MLHACLVSTLLCFVYTLRCFYMFYSTNLLTSCHNASCLFSAIFGSRKVSKEIFSKLDGTNIKVNYFPWGTKVQRGDGEAVQGSQTLPRHGQGWARAWEGCGPSGCLLGLPLHL